MDEPTEFGKQVQADFIQVHSLFWVYMKILLNHYGNVPVVLHFTYLTPEWSALNPLSPLSFCGFYELKNALEMAEFQSPMIQKQWRTMPLPRESMWIVVDDRLNDLDDYLIATFACALDRTVLN